MVTIRGGGFSVTLKGDLSFRYLHGGLQKGILRVASRYFKRGLKGGIL